MTSKALPAADLSSAFAPPSRAAGLRLPPRKNAQSAPTPSRQPVSPVPDPEPTRAPEGAQNPNSEESAHDTPLATQARAAKKASKRTAAKAQPAPQPRPAPTPGPPAPVQEAREAAGQDSRPTPRKAPAKKRTSVARESSEPGRLVLWTRLSIRSRMKALQADTERVYRDQVLDALEATHEQLPDLVAKTSRPTTTTVRGSLFERVASVTSADDKSDERKQLTIHGFLESQLDVIDHLVASTGANSRSALINAALDAYLPQR